MLNPIKINLVSLRYRGKRLEHGIIVATTFVLMAISGYNVYSGIRNRIDILVYKNKIKQIEKNIRSRQNLKSKRNLALKKGEIEAIQKQLKLANRIIAQDVFPWSRLLDILEKEIPAEIVLESFSTKNNFRVLHLSGRSTSVESVSVFLQRLEQSELFESVELGNLNLLQADTARFNIKSRIDFKTLLPEEIYGELWKIM